MADQKASCMTCGTAFVGPTTTCSSACNDKLQRTATIAHETAHAVMAEDWGFEIYLLDVDWRGSPQCRYRGQIPLYEKNRADAEISVAGYIGERLALGFDWRASDDDIEDAIAEIEYPDELAEEKPFYAVICRKRSLR